MEVAVQLPPNQSYTPNMPASQNYQNYQNYLPPNGQPEGRTNELPAELLFNAPLHPFVMMNGKPDAQPGLDLMQSQQTIQVPVLVTEEETEKPTIKRYRI